MTRPALKDRLFTGLCLLGALVMLVGGFSRGNPRVAIAGALFFGGYAVLQSVTRRLTPAARLVTGSEADHAERMAQFRATRLAGQAALLVAAGGLGLELGLEWEPGLWVAGAALLVVAVFVAGLVYFSPRASRTARAPRTARSSGPAHSPRTERTESRAPRR